MEKQIKNRITFALPENITLGSVINEILENNKLKEGRKEHLEKMMQKKETRLTIIRDAALVIVEKRIADEKLIELLEKHLQTNKEIAEKIVVELKEKIIPFAKIVDLEQEKKKTELIEKITETRPEIKIEKEKITPFVKKIETKNVEENAQKMEENLTNKKEEIIKEAASVSSPQDSDEPKKVKTVLPQEEKKGPDDYREPIE